ncbi:MAG: glycerophosphodiester phosphodiesterase [Tepidisphaeraceae bacterium]|jgi:glycerophosphoryl diester phosphodiesterase
MEAQMIVVAHRGLHSVHPENSLAAFAAAWQAGIKWCECDVHATADGVPVVIHDETLERTTAMRGLVRETEWAELSDVVPTLRQVLAAMPGDCGMLIEIKPVDEELVGAVVREISLTPAVSASTSAPGIPGEDRGGGSAGSLPTSKAALATASAQPPPNPPPDYRGRGKTLARRCIIQSFDPLNLHWAKEFDPSAVTAFLVDRPEALVDAIGGSWQGVYVNQQLLESSAIAHIRRGRQLGAWTVNSAQEISRAMRFGVDVLITNDPLLARSLSSGRSV